MKKGTMLTALLLVMMMCFSSFAVAEDGTAVLPEGSEQLTTDGSNEVGSILTYQTLMNQAQAAAADELYANLTQCTDLAAMYTMISDASAQEAMALAMSDFTMDQVKTVIAKADELYAASADENKDLQLDGIRAVLKEKAVNGYAAYEQFLLTGTESMTASEFLALKKDGSIIQLENNITITDAQIEVNSSLTVDLNGHVLKQGKQNTRVFHVTGGTLTITDSHPTRINGYVSEYTGGIITGGSNSSNYGGAILIKAGNVVLDKGTVYQCSAERGGAIGVYQSLTNDITITMNKGSTIADCSASLYGGALYIRKDGGNTDATITLTTNGATIKGCSAGEGGAIFAHQGTKVQMNEGSLITECSSTGAGGAVELYSGANMTLSGAKITNNTAGGSGGGIYVSNSHGFAISNGSVISGNKAEVSGGGIYQKNGSTNYASGIIENNSAKNNGGGIYFAGGTLPLRLTVRNNDAKNGGGIYVANTGFEIFGGAQISNNTASDNGGALYVGRDAVQSGGTVSQNKAVNGSAVFIQSGATYFMQGGTLSENTASANGGGVYVDGGSFEMIGGTISSNDAKACGGGIYVGDGSAILGVESCTGTGTQHAYDDKNYAHPVVKSNTAPYGGGFSVGGGTVTMHCGTVGGSGNNNNKAESSTHGDNLYINDGSFTIKAGSTGTASNYGLIVVDAGKLYDLRSATVPTTVNYHMNFDGSTVQPYTLTLTASSINLSSPSDLFGSAHPSTDAYVFAGWNAGGTQNEVDGLYYVRAQADYIAEGGAVQLPEGGGTLELYAIWAPLTNTIAYDFGLDENYVYEGTLITQYSPTQTSIALPAPTRSGYTLVGWTLDQSRTDITKYNSNWGSYNNGVLIETTDIRTKTLPVAGRFGNIKLTAQWELSFSTMSIEVKDAASDQCFIFNIAGVPDSVTEGISMTVAVNGNGTVTLNNVQVGEYIVSEVSGWSWRYEGDMAPKRVNVLADTPTTVFEYSTPSTQWLDDSDYRNY